MTLQGVDDKLLACIHCGFCLPACPTYRVLGDEADSPRGRLLLMRAVAEGRLPADDPSFALHLDRCLGCRACEPVCPAGVPYGELLEHARGELARVRPTEGFGKLLLATFGSRRRSGVAGFLGRAFRATGLPAVLVRLLPSRGAWRSLRMTMGMLESSSRWFGLRREGGVAQGEPLPDAPGSQPAQDNPPDHAAAPSRGRVGILAGCVQKGLFGRVSEATARTLRANGYQVVPVADAGCCGALHAHAGELTRAQAAARAQIQSFERAEVDFVVADAAGCGAAMKGYGALLEGDPAWRERAEGFAGRVRDVSELLAQAGPRPGAPLELRAAYDPPCHLKHGQGVHDPVLRLLGAIPKLEVVEVPDGDRCCGGAGIYGLTQGELGDQIAREKIRNVVSTGARVVLAGNPGCIMQIGNGLLQAGVDMGIAHPVELLDESYRRGGIYG